MRVQSSLAITMIFRVRVFRHTSSNTLGIGMRRVRRFRRQTAQHNRVRACDYMAENDIVSNKIQILGSKNSIPAKESPLYRILARPAYR